MSTSKIALVFSAIGLVILGAVAALVGEHLLYKPADARDSMETIAVMKDWRLTCPPRTDKKGGCVIQQSIVQQGTSNTLAQLTIGQKGQDNTLAIVTPLGVLLTPGLRFSVGHDQPRPVAYATCVQVGCVATLTLDAGLSAAMSQNTSGQIVVASAAGKAVPLTYSLRGFKEAVAARAADMDARKGL